MLSEQQKLETLATLATELSRVQDLDILMEKILSHARALAHADAGSIYIKKDNTLHFAYTQNDTLQKRLPNGDKLVYSTFTMPVDTRSIAGFVAATGQPLHITDVYSLPPDVPYGFSRRFDEATGYRTQSVYTLPLKNNLEEVVGVLQIINAQDGEGRVEGFSELDQRLMPVFGSIAAVALERAQMMRALLLRMIRMAEMRDPKETGAHVNRVGGYSLEIYEQWARRYGVDPEEVEKTRDMLRMAAMLHDVGKVGISDTILKKPARLTREEFEVMKGHTVFGAGLFVNPQSSFDAAAGEVALNHHERWDGNGYPGYVDATTGLPLPGYEKEGGGAIGKKEDEIPLFGRIVALCDVYDALSSRRVYKEAWQEQDVLDEIEKCSGSQFDPEIVEIFFSRLDAMRAIQDRYKDEEGNH
ncbi:MAG: HD domain-containing phosphohydrolase [Desulfatibacillaceae bacterium]